MKKKLLSFLITISAVLTMFVLPETTYAATVLVSTRSELVSALSSATAGTEIVIKNGTYNELGEIHVTKSGTAINKIVLRPQTPGGVRFTGKVTFYFQGSYIVIKDFYFDRIHFDKNSSYQTTNLIKFSGAKYCEFSGNYVYNCGNATDMDKIGTKSDIYGMYTPIVELSKGSKYNTISNNVFDDNFSISVAVVANTSYDNSYNVIENNCFKDIRRVYSWWGNVSSGNGMECIQIGQGDSATRTQSTYTTIRNNLFENIKGDEAEVISIKTSNNTIEHNTFRNCSGGLVLRFGNNSIVDGNFIFNIQSIRVYEGGHTVRNNYIEGNVRGIDLRGSDDNQHYAAENVNVYNNTVINPKEYGIKIGHPADTKHPSNVNIRNNYVLIEQQLNMDYKAYKDFNSISPTIRNNMCTVQYGNQGITNNDTVVFNTTYANVTKTDDGLYRPSADSFLIDKGEDIEGMVYDMDGQQRIGKPDCGADEYSDEAIKYKPLDIYTVCPENKWWINVCHNGYVDTGTTFEIVNGKITASRTIVTFEAESTPLSKTIIFAEYDGNKLIEMAKQTKTIKEIGTYDYSLSLDYVEGHTYKAFLWDMSEGKYISFERATQYK